LGQVADHQLRAGVRDRQGLRVVAHQRTHRFAALAQPLHDAAAELAAGADDENRSFLEPGHRAFSVSRRAGRAWAAAGAAVLPAPRRVRWP
jgi:hypothetical protein